MLRQLFVSALVFVGVASANATESFGGMGISGYTQSGRTVQTEPGAATLDVSGSSWHGPEVNADFLWFEKDGMAYVKFDWDFFYLLPRGPLQTAKLGSVDSYLDYVDDANLLAFFPKIQVGAGGGITEHFDYALGVVFQEASGGSSPVVPDNNRFATGGVSFSSFDAGVQAGGAFHLTNDDTGIVINPSVSLGVSQVGGQTGLFKGTFWNADVQAGIQLTKLVYLFAGYSIIHHDLPMDYDKLVVSDNTLFKVGILSGLWFE